MGLNRAARYWYYPGWHEPGTVLELLIGAEAWGSLPADLQRMVEAAAAETGAWMLSQMEVRNAAALKELRSQGNVEVLEFPAEVLAELQRLTRAVLRAQAEDNPQFGRVYAAFERFRADLDDWDRISEGSYRRHLKNDRR